jgi:hypothetical protein
MSIIDHPEQWPADCQQTSKFSTVDYVFLARALSHLDRDDFWKGLCSGELKAWGSSIERADFAPIQLSPMRFSNQAAAKDQILDNCTIDAMDHRSARIVRRRIPVPHWIFVTRASLEKLEKAKPAEVRAAKVLAAHFRQNSKMTRREAAEACSSYNLGLRAFDRVWVKAREQAGLPAKGAAGAPRKSPRKSPQQSPH